MGKKDSLEKWADVFVLDEITIHEGLEVTPKGNYFLSIIYNEGSSEEGKEEKQLTERQAHAWSRKHNGKSAKFEKEWKIGIKEAKEWVKEMNQPA